MKKIMNYIGHLFVLLSVTISMAARADVELPMGGLSGCPFIHEDNYDITSLLETLKSQISTEINVRNSCKQEIQGIISNLTPLQDFYKSIDPAIKQKITHSIYTNTLKALNSKKLELEMNNKTTMPEYGLVIAQIDSIESSSLANEIDLQSTQEAGKQNIEAFYRNQLLTYTSSVLGAYSSTAQNHPECVGKMTGWGEILGTILKGVAVGASLGVNPAGPVIGVAAGVGAQLVMALQDSKIRSGFNDLIRLKNYKTLACTYYTIKKTSCEYQRAYRIAQKPNELRDFIRNRFNPNRRGEYERYTVNKGRIASIGNVFTVITQMGSPLTLDQQILTSYLEAKAVDFVFLGTPPADNASDVEIKSWLLRAKTTGVKFSEFNYSNGGTPVSLGDQLKTAKEDIKSKQATILSAEILIHGNLSFLDLRRRLSSEFPNINKSTLEMKNYLTSLIESRLVLATDKGTIKAAITLLDKLQGFLDVTSTSESIEENLNYENEVISKGGAIFEELAKGSVAQLTRQSVLALAGKGVDRFNWAFGVIRNVYLNRDQVENLPMEERFSEYQKNYSILSDVIANYNAFYGSGTTFRNEELSQAITSFEKSFQKDMMDSLKLAMDSKIGWENLRGKTAAHLCALYAPTLETLSKKGFLFDNSAGKLLAKCRSTYTELGTNRLVVNDDFKINYNDECTYYDYSRESEIQNLLAVLINPAP